MPGPWFTERVSALMLLSLSELRSRLSPGCVRCAYLPTALTPSFSHCCARRWGLGNPESNRAKWTAPRAQPVLALRASCSGLGMRKGRAELAVAPVGG